MAQLQTLSKALDILNLLGRSDDPLSVEEIAGRMELPESTTYRLLQTLEAKDFIKRYSRKKIGLGSNFINLARNLHDTMERDLILIAAPYMEQVRDETEESVILSVRAGLESRCISSISSRHIIRFVAEANRILHLDVGASSRVILAHEDERVIDRIRMEKKTEEERIRLNRDLERIRENGYDITESQHDIGSVGIGVPVFNTYGKIYASLAVVAPDTRVKRDRYPECVAVLKEAAGQISAQLAKAETEDV